MRIGIPALAGLSVMHGLVPPHPGPLVAIDAVSANLGVTLALGVLVGHPDGDHRRPAVLEGRGPLGGRPGARRMIPSGASEDLEKRPGFGATLATDAAAGRPDAVQGAGRHRRRRPRATAVQRVFDVVGSPLIALLAACSWACSRCGRAAGFTKDRISTTVEKGLAPIAGILLIVGAGGGFKQTLIDSGVGQMILEISEDWSIPALLLAWLIAVAIRLGDRLRDRRHDLGGRPGRPARRDMSTTHTALLVWPSAPARCSSATSTTPGSGWSRSTSA